MTNAVNANVWLRKEDKFDGVAISRKPEWEKGTSRCGLEETPGLIVPSNVFVGALDRSLPCQYLTTQSRIFAALFSLAGQARR